jgi:hypothetical protein
MIFAIFDLDDTLYPTSGTLCGIPGEWTEKYEKSVETLLEEARKLSAILVIITSAEKKWAEKCRERIPCLKKYPILSCQDFDVGKKTMFVEIVKLFLTEGSMRNGDIVLSVGDMVTDRSAVFEVGKVYPDLKTISILFDKEPSLEKLHQEQKLLREMFQQILAEGHSDYMMHGINPVQLSKEFDETLRGQGCPDIWVVN